jgi:hypothetical protein
MVIHRDTAPHARHRAELMVRGESHDEDYKVKLEEREKAHRRLLLITLKGRFDLWEHQSAAS